MFVPNYIKIINSFKSQVQNCAKAGLQNDDADKYVYFCAQVNAFKLRLKLLLKLVLAAPSLLFYLHYGIKLLSLIRY